MRPVNRPGLAALAGAAAVSLLAGLAGVAGAGPASAGTASAASATAVPRYNHIAVIMDTDHDYGSIIGNKFAPTINRLARTYGLATHYYTTSDPDTADIMALLAGNSFGISDGLPYWDQQLHVTSLLTQLTKAHRRWREYAEGVPYAGYLGNCYPTLCVQTDSLYNQTQVNPVPDLASVSGDPAQARNIVPGTELATDARGGRLPAFSLIDPDECADMHGGPPWCEDSSNSYHQQNDNQLVSAGDSYIGQVVHEIMSGPQWEHGNNAIVVTFTEGDTSAGCCDVKPGTGHVVTIVITSHGPRHLSDGRPFNHYSLLRTIETAFRLPCLRHACDRTIVPMARLFGAKSDPRVRAAAARPAISSKLGGAPGPWAAATDPRPDASSSAEAAASSLWRVVASPNTGPNDNDLAAISGRSPRDIWAVGSLLPNANSTRVRTLALHYNGSAWSRVRTADIGTQANSLYAVSALGDGTAWAVGIYTTGSGHAGRALAEHWNGHDWAVVPAANPGSSDDILYGVAAVSDTNVWAAGAYRGADEVFRPLLEHWNGRRWAVARVGGLAGAHGILTSVSHAAGSVWAAGQVTTKAGPDRQVVLLRSNGAWVVADRSAVRLGGPGGSLASAYPQAVAASAAGPWVAGSDRAGHGGFSTLVSAPFGSKLAEQATVDPTPQDNYLTGVASVASGGAAWVVGYSVQVATGNAEALIEYGTATAGWQLVPSPDPGDANSGNTFIDGVLAFSANDVWAVGTYDGASGMRTLVMHYAGGAS